MTAAVCLAAFSKRSPEVLNGFQEMLKTGRGSAGDNPGSGGTFTFDLPDIKAKGLEHLEKPGKPPENERCPLFSSKEQVETKEMSTPPPPPAVRQLQHKGV